MYAERVCWCLDCIWVVFVFLNKLNRFVTGGGNIHPINFNLLLCWPFDISFILEHPLRRATRMIFFLLTDDIICSWDSDPCSWSILSETGSVIVYMTMYILALRRSPFELRCGMITLGNHPLNFLIIVDAWLAQWVPDDRYYLRRGIAHIADGWMRSWFLNNISC